MAEPATDLVLRAFEVRLAGGMLALNRFTMTLQNKRMPVAGIEISGERGGTRIKVLLDCPEETARRYAALLEGLEDVHEIRDAEGETPPNVGRAAAVDYDGRRFASVENSETGEVGPETVFHYHQDGDVVWATYEGGDVRFGTLIAHADEEGRLDARYGHVNARGGIMTGECRSVPEMLEDGRVRLHEKWRWTSGDLSSGRSIVEEIANGSAEGGR